MQESSQKRSEYRNQIRRRQMEEIMHMNRNKHLEMQIREQQKQIIMKTQTVQKRKEWIYEKVSQMGENPNKSWFQIIRELSISTKQFQSDYTDWLQSGLIKKLLLVLKEQYRSFNLAEISASTLQDIFYYLPEDSPQVKIILQYDFAEDLVQLCKPSDISAINFYELINSILNGREQLRDIFINNGIIQALKYRLAGYQEQKNKDQIESALTLINILTKVYSTKTINCLTPKTIATITPTLNHLISIFNKQKLISLILKIFFNLSQLQKQVIYQEIYNCNNLINYILKAIINENQLNRKISIRIFVYITSTNKQFYVAKLLEIGLIDNLLIFSQILESIEKQKQINIENQKFFILCCLSNIIANSQKDAEYVLHHPIFENLIISSSQQPNKETHHKAIYCINSIILLQKFQLSSFLLESHPILEIFVSSLSYLVIQTKIQVILQILTSIQKLIILYQQIYTGQNNIIIHQLQNYGILKVLQQLENSNNCQITKKIGRILQLINNSS